MTLVAIHQPNFFPWLGYFDKIRRADVFVFLDEVDYPRSGSGGMGSWSNRVKIAVNGSPHWLTAPLKKLTLGEPISAARIDDSRPWRKKALKTLQASYGRAPNFDEAYDLIETCLMRETSNLAEYNMANIELLSKRLGISTRFVRQSDVACTGKATERLIELTKAVGGTAYLSGGGASGYQEPELFDHAGIDLVMQNFSPAPYSQNEKFLPGLSVIDYLMRSGEALEKET